MPPEIESVLVDHARLAGLGEVGGSDGDVGLREGALDCARAHVQAQRERELLPVHELEGPHLDLAEGGR